MVGRGRQPAWVIVGSVWSAVSPRLHQALRPLCPAVRAMPVGTPELWRGICSPVMACPLLVGFTRLSQM